MGSVQLLEVIQKSISRWFFPQQKDLDLINQVVLESIVPLTQVFIPPPSLFSKICFLSENALYLSCLPSFQFLQLFPFFYFYSCAVTPECVITKVVEGQTHPTGI